MLHYLKQLVPNPLIDSYHRFISWLAAVWYGHPSRELIVVGVTGTNGKTTTSYFIAKALEATGERSGCTTTALFKIGTKEWLNDKKMTMLGRFQLQKMLRDMVSAGCRYAVIETSSQGIVQHRHRHIAYDAAVFTNLTPEHVEAHGGFEKYKQAKIELFRHVATRAPKKIAGAVVPKLAVLNRMSDQAKDFAVAGFDRTVWYGIGATPSNGFECVSATDLEDRGWSTAFTVDGIRAEVRLPGEVNVENAMAAIATATALGLPLASVMKKIETVHGVPGRFERIDEGQPYTVLVDYAVEPIAMGKLYDVVEKLPHARIIHVLGSCGGGRDVARRPVIGRIAGERADVVVVTNEDPYDDDPAKIIEDVAKGARDAGKGGDALQTVLDRREAIGQAIREARPGDIVLLTGKGCEQAIMGKSGTRIPWDEREVAREAVREMRKVASSM